MQRSPLAELLGEPSTRIQFETVHGAAIRALALLRASLGDRWVNRHFHSELLAELSAPPTSAAAKRLSDRKGTHRLFGAGVDPSYAAFAIDLSESSPPGWRVLQATVLAGLLVRRRIKSAIGEGHIRAVSQFLTGTVSRAPTREGEDRTKYLSEFTPDLDITQVLRSTSSHAPRLPEGFTKGVERIAEGIRSSKQPGDIPPPKPVPDSISGPYVRNGPAPSYVVGVLRHDDDNEVIAGASEALTEALKEVSLAAAEAEAEQVSTVPANIVEPEEAATFHVRAAISRRLFLDVSHGFWTRLQWDALSPSEMSVAVSAWKERADSQLRAGDLPGTEAALLVLLTGCTGWPDERVWATPLLVSGEALPENHDRAFVYDTGEMVFPVPSVGSKYNPKESQQQLLLPVTDQVRLRLPGDVTSLMQRYVKARPPGPCLWMRNSLGELREFIRTIQRHERGDEPRETLARVRNGHALQLLTSSQDLALSQVACGELLGASDVGLTYYAGRRCDVQSGYDAACAAHGFSPSEGLPSLELVGGSRLQIPPQTVHRVADHLRKGLGQPNARLRVSATEAIKTHNSYAPAVAWQFCAATLMRPNDSIGSLTLANISFSHNVVVIADKIVDEGHIGRLVALPDILVETLNAYGHHIFALSRQAGVADSVRKAARDALAGTGPLFFLLRNGRAEPLTLKDMRQRLPRGWALPENFLRHRYASLLREHGCPAPYVEAAMGHVEMGAQPFGRESFMDPVAYVDEVRRCIQELLLQDGFKPLHGLASDQKRVWHAEPLGGWVLELRPNHQRRIDGIREEHRRRLEIYRNEGADQVADKVSKALHEHLPDFFSRNEGRIDKELGKKIRKALTHGAESIAELQVLVERLRDEFVTARKLRQWKIARLPYFHGGKVEATPFATSYPRAMSAFAELRVYFVEVLNGKRKAPRTFTSRVRLILALILWHGVAEWPRLEALLQNVNRGRRIEGLGDSIVIPVPLNDTRERETAELLRGPVAIAAAQFIGAPQEPANKRRLSEQIHRSLPSWIASGDEKGFLDVLLEAAAISHAFESPAVLRDVWVGAASSVTMSTQRIERLFTPHPIPLAACVAPEKSRAERDLVSISLPAAHVTEFRHYRRLRKILRVPKGLDKHLPYQGIDLPVGTSKPRMRDEILSELRTHLAALPGSDTPCRLLTLYATKLFERGTPSHSKIEPDTVYQYVIGVGAFLVRLHAKAVLTETESEGLLQIYTELVRAAPSDYQPMVAKYLSYFHEYLVSEHDAVPVDLRGIGGFLAGIPDVGFIAPVELVQAENLLVDAKDQPQSASIHVCQQSRNVLRLGFATGARSSEIVLREQRDLVAEAGRTTLLIKRNRMTGVKTARGIRLVSLEGWMAPQDVARIKRDAEGLANQAKPSAPLFPDSDEPSKPTNPGAIAAAVGAALRAATNDASAHLYWLRHTAASLEFLYLFGDTYLLEQINKGEASRVPFPFGTKEQFARRLGGSEILSQVHGSAYLGRRGHASIRTGQASYIHVVGLIEPYASRTTRKQIFGEGRANLLGRSHTWVRQVVSRANAASADDERITCALLDKTIEAARALEASEQQTLEMPLTAVKVRDVFRCVQRYFSAGDTQSALAMLKSTRFAEQRAAKIFTDIHIKAASTRSGDRRAEIHATLVNAAPQRIELFVGPKSLDADLVDAALRYMRVHAKAAGQGEDLWRSILDGFDQQNKLVRFKTAQELKATVAAFDRVFASRRPKGRLALVIDPTVPANVLEHEVASDPQFATLHIVRERVPDHRGHIALAVTYVTPKGQFRLNTLLLLAVTWVLWSELRA